jgi:hypothetical protein
MVRLLLRSISRLAQRCTHAVSISPGFGPLVAAFHACDLKEENMPPNENRHGQQPPQDARDSRHDAGHPREPQAAGAPVEPTETMKQSNPPRASVHPEQTAEVPHGTGNHPEPPGGGGRPSQRKRPDDTRKP